MSFKIWNSLPKLLLNNGIVMSLVFWVTVTNYLLKLVTVVELLFWPWGTVTATLLLFSCNMTMTDPQPDSLTILKIPRIMYYDTEMYFSVF